MKKLGDLWHALKGLDDDVQYNLNHYAVYLTEEDSKTVEYLLKYRKAGFEDHRFPASERLLPEAHYPQLKTSEAKYEAFIAKTNATVRDGVWDEQVKEFAKKAFPFLTTQLSPHLVGVEHIKEAVALQLVMPERFHILLLGDPGTGKTDILRSAAEFAHISSFGLGSGASKAGLAVSMVGKQLHEGLLVQASGGLCCIDELNLMKVEDRAALYNAMEKGVVHYDKGSHHQVFPADVRLLATANPKGDQFRGKGAETLRKQLPFEGALLSRFNLVFIVRKPDVKQFREISKQVLQKQAKPLSKEDIQFIHEYVRRARALDVMLPPHLEKHILDAATEYKAKEKELLFEVTPRLTRGLVSLAKAAAAIELRPAAEERDVQQAMRILNRAMHH